MSDLQSIADRVEELEARTLPSGGPALPSWNSTRKKRAPAGGTRNGRTSTLTGSAAVAVSLVSVETSVELCPLFVGEVQHLLLRSDAVPQVLDKFDALID